ncbi:N-carbamoylsarcosine amidase [Streptomyces sulfonofaciens]|uniref:N-carbamoylsarcosine amidase n=1 Tax=Streptomyces sulfonofaciens TaxID=68272 RepID=A0A919L507_9ACTN|nr:isochorismatase family protein [Streptomyces sulfonofaciens]GHH82916.1 N-carbamoylsarcosine amidase [Streptomyces sulfonofaciens]
MTARAMTQHTEKLADKWGAHFPAAELEVLAAAGYGARMGFGERPALLVVDVTYSFCGTSPMPVLDAVRANRRSCGAWAWEAVGSMRRLIDAARTAQLPVVYSTMLDPGDAAYEPGLWGAKNARGKEDSPAPAAGPRRDNDVVDDIRPAPGDLVVAKGKPSIFHGTNLLDHLIARGVDSLIICGGTSSGCVYASAVDGFSHNLKVTVVRDACFDRVETPHWASLLDIDMKYGDVIGIDEAVAHLGGLTCRVS